MSKRMNIVQARSYIQNTYGVVVSRQTIHNWMTKGVQGRKLAAEQIGRTWYLIEEQIDDFCTNRLSR